MEYLTAWGGIDVRYGRGWKEWNGVVQTIKTKEEEKIMCTPDVSYGLRGYRGTWVERVGSQIHSAISLLSLCLSTLFSPFPLSSLTLDVFCSHFVLSSLLSLCCSFPLPCSWQMIRREKTEENEVGKKTMFHVCFCLLLGIYYVLFLLLFCSCLYLGCIFRSEVMYVSLVSSARNF